MTIHTIRYFDEYGQLIWQEPMIFKRLFAVGDVIAEKGEWYEVVGVKVEDSIQVVFLAKS